MHTILLIDSDPLVRCSAVSALSTLLDHPVVLATNNGTDGLRLIQQHAPDLVIFDLVLPGIDGLELLTYLQSHCPETSLLMTASNRLVLRDLQKRFGESHSICTLPKPFAAPELIDTATVLLQTRPVSVLRDVALVSVLQLAHFEGKSCRLEVEGVGGRGTVNFLRGQVVYAACGERAGMEALQQMMTLPRPVCRIYAGEERLPAVRNVHAQFTELLLLCCSASDENCQVA